MSARQFQTKLGAYGEQVSGLDELEQSVRIVLSTQLGSVPGRPGFGTRLDELQDIPLPLARARVVREVLRALRTSEPRIEVVAVNVQGTPAGKLTAAVTWRPTGAVAAALRTTEVKL